MKKMFSIVVLALSLSLNAQHVTVTPHVTTTPHVTVTSHVTTTPHVSAPVHISEPVHVTTPTHVSEPTPVTKANTTVVNPITVVPRPITTSNSLADTSKNKSVDTTKSTSATEVKQVDATPTTNTPKNSGMPWGFIGIIAVIVGTILFVVIKPNEEEVINVTSANEVLPSEPENMTPADGSTAKEVTKEDSSK